MALPRRKSHLSVFPTLLFVCALLAVPAETFHLHADKHAHADCPICLNAFTPAILTSAPLPAVVFCGFNPLPVSPLAGPTQRQFTGNNQLSCGPPRG